MTGSLRVLVTGATGYIGGHLVPPLLDKGHYVRVMVRDPSRLAGLPWSERVDVVIADALKPETLPSALQDVDVAYYNIHSLYKGSGFEDSDVAAGRWFGAAAREAGLQRIIYLGGLGDPSDTLSPHLHSRQQTGAALSESGVPVTEFRAPIVIGAGSGSFEMIRYLTERIPLLVSPRWIFSKVQPIAIDDVIEYLVRALDVPQSTGRVLEIGGPEVMTYADTMVRYASARGLRRRVLPLPVLTPSLSSHWVGWVTPISARLARPLIEGVHNEVIVRDGSARDLFPEIEPIGYDAAVTRALSDLDPRSVNTDLIDARASVDSSGRSVSVLRQEGLYVRRECLLVRSSAKTLFQTVAGLGGDRGWRRFNWVWRLRGLADRVAGGIGFRKGRRDPNSLRLDDTVDFLSVDGLEPDRLIRFKYDGRMPGRLWLQFEADPDGEDAARFCGTVFVETKGLIGLLYWYVTYPAHAAVFSGLQRDVISLAEQTHASQLSPSSPQLHR